MPESITWTLASADQKTFAGPAYTRMLAGADAEVPAKVYFVRFEPTARTNWHAHSGRQILIVVSGTCRYQREGEEAHEIGAGESVSFEPGERHWHGATSTATMDHLAINLDNRETTWLQPVTEDEYRS